MIGAEVLLQDQRRTLYNDLRTAESREASAIEKRLSDEQTTATRLAEEHDAARCLLYRYSWVSVGVVPPALLPGP